MNELPEIPESEAEESVSKSQLKREAKQRQEFADMLLNLPNKLFNQLPAEGELLEALTVGRKLDNRNARKRQLRYIGRLLGDSEMEKIEAHMQQAHQQSLQLHSRKEQVEQWCNALLADDMQLLDTLVERYPFVERQQLRQLIRQASKEARQKNTEPSTQKLFRYLLENT